MLDIWLLVHRIWNLLQVQKVGTMKRSLLVGLGPTKPYQHPVSCKYLHEPSLDESEIFTVTFHGLIISYTHTAGSTWKINQFPKITEGN